MRNILLSGLSFSQELLQSVIISGCRRVCAKLKITYTQTQNPLGKSRNTCDMVCLCSGQLSSMCTEIALAPKVIRYACAQSEVQMIIGETLVTKMLESPAVAAATCLCPWLCTRGMPPCLFAQTPLTVNI